MDRDALLVDTDDISVVSRLSARKTSSGEAEARVSISNDPGNYLPTERSKARSRGVLR
jgi:hypothetical protein